MRLSYDKDQKHFVLAPASVKNFTASDKGNWIRFAKNTYVTRDFRAAREWKDYAEGNAKRLLERAFVKRYSLPKKALPKILDPHQVEGVKWALTRSRSYLAHPPGAGKTLEAIVTALFTPGPGQVVFIVPPSLTLNWERETHRFVDMLAPGSLPTVAIIPESPKADQADWEADYIIVPDSMLHKEWVLTALLGMRIRFLAVDEASRFKEPSAVRSIALFGGIKEKFKSPGLIYTPRHVVLLDGSPMPNRSIELWAPTFAMSPESIDFMSEKQFSFAYCDPKQNARGEWEFKGSTNEGDLKRRLQESFMHVVSEERLGHSPRLRSIVFVDDLRSADVKSWDRKWVARARAFGLEKITQSHFVTGVRVRDQQGELATMRKESGLAMVKPSARYIAERLESGEAVLVFAWHREVVLELAKALKKYAPGIIMGGTDKNDREAFLTSFQGGKRDLLIMNIAAGGRGHNIQRADRIVFVEPSWSDEQNKQCEKRASRRGRSVLLPVKSDYLVTAGSINEMVLSSAFTKEGRVKRVIG